MCSGQRFWPESRKFTISAKIRDFGQKSRFREISRFSGFWTSQNLSKPEIHGRYMSSMSELMCTSEIRNSVRSRYALHVRDMHGTCTHTFVSKANSCMHTSSNLFAQFEQSCALKIIFGISSRYEMLFRGFSGLSAL